MTSKEITAKLPYGSSFLFVDELLHIDESGVVGCYTYTKQLPFYEAHFLDFPVTPAVILTETMAQIGLVCLGIYLLDEKMDSKEYGMAMTATVLDFLKPVYPGEKVTVTSEKIYFRFNKLSCKVKMQNESGDIVCKGTLSGMLTQRTND